MADPLMNLHLFKEVDCPLSRMSRNKTEQENRDTHLSRLAYAVSGKDRERFAREDASKRLKPPAAIEMDPSAKKDSK